MSATFSFSLITLEGLLFDGPVTSISAPGQEGSFGVLAGHAQMVAALKAGPLDVTPEEGDVQHFVVSNDAVCEVRQNQTVVLAEKAQRVSGPDEVKELLASAYAAR